MAAAIVIPARFASTRFPGKPLAPIAGVSLIRRVYERAARAGLADVVYVATDDARIRSHVSEFGGRVTLTTGDFATGTDRVAAAVGTIEQAEGRRFEQVVNVQGDEPLVDPESIDRLIEALVSDAGIDIATLACAIVSEEEFQSRDVVKVVTDLTGNALYFSRAPIPHQNREYALRHVGLYGYQRSALRRLAQLPPTALESAESLEQLRALQNGFRIRVLHTDQPHLGVDRPEDVARVEEEIARSRR